MSKKPVVEVGLDGAGHIYLSTVHGITALSDAQAVRVITDVARLLDKSGRALPGSRGRAQPPAVPPRPVPLKKWRWWV